MKLIAFKPLIVLLVLVTACLHLYAQNNSDCNTAVSVCNAVYDEEDSPAGTGNVYEVAPGSCQTGGEFNSAWYVFSPQNDGLLSFILQPNDDDDDYDWSLFDITEGGCAGINTGASPEVSCNSYGLAGGIEGPTGISSDEGGFGNNNGPGDLNGPPFNADLNVTAGSVYALVVMNYSSTLDGYTLDFNESAVSIFDETAPVMTDYTFSWCTGELTLNFDEEVVVSALSPADFGFTNPDLSVTGFDAPGNDYATSITLTIGPLPLLENIQTDLISTGDVLADICGNEVAMPMALDLQGGFEFEIITTSGCNGTGASLDVQTNGNDNIPPYTVVVNGNVEGNLPLQDIDAGVYNVEITDGIGCSVLESVNISSQTSNLTAPGDTTLCSLSGTFDATWQGGNITWSTNDPIDIDSPNSTVTTISSQDAGTYLVTVSVTSGDCIAEEFFQVTFNYPPMVEITTTDVTCHNACNGTLTVTNGNPDAITVVFSGNQDTGTEVLFENLCAGDYNMNIIHSPECTVDHSFSITEPMPVVAGFESSDWIVPLKNPAVVLTSLSENYDSLFWSIAFADTTLIMDDTLTSNLEVWDLMLPYEAGVYEVHLTALDTSGCRDDITGYIEVRDEFAYYVPNSFTPNDDGLNDVFQVYFTYPPEKFELIVYNRWGDVVFKAKDYKDVWMGDMRQGDIDKNAHTEGEYYCPNGVYEWQLTARGVERDEKTHRGWVLLNR
jgi:gliding motility-associated-like protein